MGCALKKILCILLSISLFACTSKSKNNNKNTNSKVSIEQNVVSQVKNGYFSSINQKLGRKTPDESQRLLNNVQKKEQEANQDQGFFAVANSFMASMTAKDTISKSNEDLNKKADISPYVKKVATFKTGFKVNTFSIYYGNYTLLLQIPKNINFSSKSNKELMDIARNKIVNSSDENKYLGIQNYSTIESKYLSPNINIDTDLTNLLATLDLNDKLNDINEKISDYKKQIETLKNKEAKGISVTVKDKNKKTVASSDKKTNISSDLVLTDDKKQIEQEHLADLIKIDKLKKDIEKLDKDKVALNIYITNQKRENDKQKEYVHNYNLVDSYFNENLQMDYTRRNLKDIYLSDPHIELLKNFTSNLNPDKKYIAIINILGTTLPKWFDDNMRIERTIYTQYVYDYFLKNFKNIRVEKRYVDTVPQDQIFIILSSYDGDIPENVYNADKGNILEWLTNYQKLEKEQQDEANLRRQELDNELVFPTEEEPTDNSNINN